MVCGTMDGVVPGCLPVTEIPAAHTPVDRRCGIRWAEPLFGCATGGRGSRVMKVELEGCGEFADSACVAAQLAEQLRQWLVEGSTSGDDWTGSARGS